MGWYLYEILPLSRSRCSMFSLVKKILNGDFFSPALRPLINDFSQSKSKWELQLYNKASKVCQFFPHRFQNYISSPAGWWTSDLIVFFCSCTFYKVIHRNFIDLKLCSEPVAPFWRQKAPKTSLAPHSGGFLFLDPSMLYNVKGQKKIRNTCLSKKKKVKIRKIKSHLVTWQSCKVR